MILDKRLAVTGAAVAVVTITAITAALMPRQQDAAPIQEPVSDVAISQGEESPLPSQAEEDYLYLLKEYEGKVALFFKGSDTPELVFERPVKHLPEYDRIQLREGIKIADSEALAARIEDFIS